MEHTKDMILEVHYGEVHNEMKTDGRRWTSRVLQTIRRHKIITTTILSAVVFISIDAVLITNFFRILTLV